MIHYRIFVSPLAGFADSSTYKFVAEFADPAVAGAYMRYMHGKRRYANQNIIIKEVPSAGVDSREGKVGCVLSVMGEYLPIDEYEFR